jgi:hypothetical protein
MNARPFGYQLQHLGAARTCLMAPHSVDEDRSFESALLHCYFGLVIHPPNETLIAEESARSWLATIRKELDRSVDGQMVQCMSLDEKREFSKAVDNLATWFGMEFWSRGNEPAA